MSQAAELAAFLTEGDDLTAAAILVALHDDPTLEIQDEDAEVVARLEALSCVAAGGLTPLGAQVAMRLRASGVVRPRPGAQA